MKTFLKGFKTGFVLTLFTVTSVYCIYRSRTFSLFLPEFTFVLFLNLFILLSFQTADKLSIFNYILKVFYDSMKLFYSFQHCLVLKMAMSTAHYTKSVLLNWRVRKRTVFVHIWVKDHSFNIYKNKKSCDPMFQGYLHKQLE